MHGTQETGNGVSRHTGQNEQHRRANPLLPQPNRSVPALTERPPNSLLSCERTCARVGTPMAARMGSYHHPRSLASRARCALREGKSRQQGEGRVQLQQKGNVVLALLRTDHRARYTVHERSRGTGNRAHRLQIQGERKGSRRREPLPRPTHGAMCLKRLGHCALESLALMLSDTQSASRAFSSPAVYFALALCRGGARKGTGNTRRRTGNQYSVHEGDNAGRRTGSQTSVRGAPQTVGRRVPTKAPGHPGHACPFNPAPTN